MNKILKGFIFAFVVLLGLSITFSLILAAVTTKTSSKIPNIISLILSLILFFLIGGIYGLINKKQGLTRSLLLCLAYVLIVCIYYLFIDKSSQTPFTYLKVIGRVLMLIVGSIIGVNLSDKKIKSK